MTRIYIAGPCSGLPENNYPAFHEAAARLRALGHDVTNPAENPAPPCGTWRGYMRMSIPQVAQADMVVLLPGWTASEGARWECEIAARLGLVVKPLAEATGESK
jgi:hypothetical protein